MSHKKDATDDPPRSPSDQDGGANRSFNIHEIKEMSDDDADQYRAALWWPTPAPLLACHKLVE